MRTSRQAAALEVTTGLDVMTDETFKMFGTHVTDPDTHQTLVRVAEGAEARRDAETLATTFTRDATGANVLAKASRYEVALERSLYRTLHEPRTAAARRAGDPVPYPLAVDVVGSGPWE